MDAAFEREGFTVLRGFLAGEALASLLSVFERLLDGVDTVVPSEMLYREDPARPETLKQIQHLERWDATIAALARGRVRAAAETLLGEPADLRNVQAFLKPPGEGRATPPHQDGAYLHLDPPRALTAWLALDPVDEASGGLRYVRGSHRQGLREHARTDILGFSQALVTYGEVDRASEVAVPAAPGDLIVHHALTIHRADANRGSRPRRALGFVFYGASAREDAERHAAYAMQLQRDLRAAGRL